MAKLLYVESSPRKERSASIAVAQTFLKAYAETHPHDVTDTVDLWSFPMPEFNGAAINAKYKVMHGQPHMPEEAEAWEGIKKVFNRFSNADKYIFSLPMWNFGIPYKLKHLFDVIVQPGLAFNFSPETGYTGLVTGRPAMMIYARGGEYTSSLQMKAYDLQKAYMELILGFIGFTDLRTILIEATLSGPDQAKASLAAAKVQAAKLAREF